MRTPASERPPAPSLARSEFGIILFFGLCWIVFVAMAWLGYPLAGTIRLDLYLLYGLAAALGWMLGNLEVLRRRRAEAGGGLVAERRGFYWLHLLMPGGLFYLLWALAQESLRSGFPLAPLYALGVYVVLFLVPVSLRRAFRADR